MIVSINQPAFLPWLGYFDRIARSDVHIVLDHVQFEKNSVTNRNKINTNNGALWLTVPVITSGMFGSLAIDQLQISNQTKWQKKTTESIKQFYRKAPYFNAYFPFIEECLSKEWLLLNGLIKELNSYLFSELEISTRLLYSSEMNAEGTKGDLVLNLCKEVDASVYLSGPFGRDYLDLAKFSEQHVEVKFHDYSHPVYAQNYPDFTSHLSIIDLLFNHGKQSRSILTQ